LTEAFFADGKLKKIDAGGEPVQILCDAPNGRGGAWNLITPPLARHLRNYTAICIRTGSPVKELPELCPSLRF